MFQMSQLHHGFGSRLLPDGQVDLWYSAQEKAASPRLIRAYWQRLTAEERATVRRYKHTHVRHQALLARTLLRWVLSQYCPVDPADWRFGRGTFGKPFVAAPEGAFPAFNLSHSAGIVVCAVAWAQHVGVDVEGMGRRPNCTQLAQRYFAASEAADIARLSEAEQRDRFLRYWTLKEAYIKATGRGLTEPLNSFAFELRPDGDPIIHFSDGRNREDWRFGEVLIAGSHRVSVATQGSLVNGMVIEPGNNHGGRFRLMIREVVPFV